VRFPDRSRGAVDVYLQADPAEKLASLESAGCLFPHLPFEKSLHRDGSAFDECQDVCYNEH
jgi:hypothetical protein